HSFLSCLSHYGVQTRVASAFDDTGSVGFASSAEPDPVVEPIVAAAVAVAADGAVASARPAAPPLRTKILSASTSRALMIVPTTTESRNSRNESMAKKTNTPPCGAWLVTEKAI